AVERLPVRAPVGGFEHTAARHGDVEVPRVARIDEDGVHLGAVGRAVLVAPAPRLAFGVIVEAGDTLPGHGAVFALEESLRRGARIPHARLARVTGREPEYVIDAAPALLLAEGRRLPAFAPGPAAVLGTEHGRPEVPGARSGEQRAPVAGIEH